jgi:monoamine oxidase
MYTENLFCAGTYQKILALIAKPALEKATIKLSTKISKINAADGAHGKVKVTTEKGEALKFDEIVVTAPLGWLKQNQEAFTPPLPPRFSSAIESIGYGCLEKVCIQ